MANKAISELPQAQNVNNQDLFVLEQSGIAKKLPAETFITEQGIINALAEALDGHGGIQSVTLSSVSGRIRTYRITFTDQSATTFQVYDGTSIDRISRTSSSGLDDVYTIFLSDGTTTFFTVHNGADGTVSEAMLNDALKDKAPAITETTESSAIATFTDGADDLVMHNVVAEINPVQDLTYGDPYPAGSGKNKLPNDATTSTIQGVTYTVNSDGTIGASGKSTGWTGLTVGTVTLPAGDYILSAGVPSNNFYNLYLSMSGGATGSTNSGDFSFTLTSESAITIKLFARPSIQQPSGSIVYPMIRLATVTDGAYAPYANVCPISGWTGCNVTRTGINVWDEEWENGFYSRATGEKAGNSDTTYFRSKNYIPCAPNTSYYFKAPSVHASNNTYYAVLFYGADKNYISAINSGIGNTAQTTPQNAHFMTIFIQVGTSGATYQNDISVNYPSTDHDYHAYTGESISVSWQTEAGTVYGGTIDVATGLLTVDRAIKTLTANDSYSVTSNGQRTRVTWDDFQYMGKIAGHFVADRLKSKDPSPGGYGSGDWEVWGSTAAPKCWISAPLSIATVADFTAWLADNPVQLVYELATPQTYQLTPQEVKTLLGTNNVWADTGNVSVTYTADTKMFIEKLTMPTEDDMVANQAITSGKYFMIGNSLYLALANIASGAQITIGTNAQRVSLADALNTINA